MSHKEQSSVLYRQIDENEIIGTIIDDSPMDIPDHAFDTLARYLIPIIEEFYEKETNQRAFEEWKTKQSE